MIQAPSNTHHGIPRSCGGSNHACNRSKVEIPRHADYHQWATNYTPDQIVRLLACQGIGLEDRSLHPQSIATIFRITNQCAESRFYLQEAIVQTSKLSKDREREIKHTQKKHNAYERLLMQNTIHALQKGGMFPSHTEPFLAQSLAFFDTSFPREALHSLYTETSHGKLSWVNPIMLDMRHSIHAIVVADPHLERFTGNGRKTALLHVLESQLSLLEHVSHDQREWTKPRRSEKCVPHDQKECTKKPELQKDVPHVEKVWAKPSGLGGGRRHHK